VVGALGAAKPGENPEESGENRNTELLQKVALMGTARILKKVLDTG